MKIDINGQSHDLDVPADMPLLWALRDVVGLTGTKYGCGTSLCGACTVHIDGEPTRACVTPVGSIGAKKVTTIEAIGESPLGKRVQAAWIAEDVPQCGYCQSGQIMSAVSLLTAKPAPTDGDIDTALAGNLCRCGTYNRIRAAIKRAANPA
jgi:isoquinoline 1-oxidoreductase alpha subunit